MLADLSNHESIRVRQAALERIEAHQPSGIAATLRERLIAEPDDQLKALALRALSAVEGPSSRDAP